MYTRLSTRWTKSLLLRIRKRASSGSSQIPLLKRVSNLQQGIESTTCIKRVAKPSILLRKDRYLVLRAVKQQRSRLCSPARCRLPSQNGHRELAGHFRAMPRIPRQICHGSRPSKSTCSTCESSSTRTRSERGRFDHPIYWMQRILICIHRQQHQSPQSLSQGCSNSVTWWGVLTWASRHCSTMMRPMSKRMVNRQINCLAVQPTSTLITTSVKLRLRYMGHVAVVQEVSLFKHESGKSDVAFGVCSWESISVAYWIFISQSTSFAYMGAVLEGFRCSPRLRVLIPFRFTVTTS